MEGSKSFVGTGRSIIGGNGPVDACPSTRSIRARRGLALLGVGAAVLGCSCGGNDEAQACGFGSNQSAQSAAGCGAGVPDGAHPSSSGAGSGGHSASGGSGARDAGGRVNEPTDGGRTDASAESGIGSADVGADAALGDRTDGGAVVAPAATRWLAFQTGTAGYVFDFNDSASAAAPLKLGSLATFRGVSTERSSPWSPDGRWLLYFEGADLYSLRMDGAVPGTPNFLGSGFPTTGLAPLSFSGDSRSLAYFDGSNLSILEVALPNPPVTLVASTVRAFGWAPRGTRLAFLDDAGFFVVDVVAGKPAQPTKIVDPQAASGGISFYWSPTGDALIVGVSGHFEFVDLRGPLPVTTIFTAPSAPSVAGFDSNGSRAWLLGSEFSYVAIAANGPGTPRPVDQASPFVAASAEIWSPSLPYLKYRVGGKDWAVDLSGTTPGTPVALPFVENDSLWVPNGSVLVATTGRGPTSIDAFDFRNPDAGVMHLADVAVGAAYSLQVSSDGAMFGYLTDTRLDLLSTNGGPVRRLDQSLDGSISVFTVWRWSPKGHSIALGFRNADGAAAFTVGVATVDGPAPSLSAKANVETDALVDLWFQP